MTTLLDSLRGTLIGVMGVAEHLAWYVEWEAGGRRCARSLGDEPERPGEPALGARAA